MDSMGSNSRTFRNHSKNLKTNEPMKTRLFLLLFSIAFINVCKAQLTDTINKPQLVFEIPLIDLPYQIDAAKTVNNGNVSLQGIFKGYANPSMHQSLNLSADLYTGLHYGYNHLFKTYLMTETEKAHFGKRLLYSLGLSTIDYISIFAPGFDGWEHEEYHRAVLSRFHIKSFNDMNKFPIGAETTSVNSITDEDLIRFKAESPADFVRMNAAGIEGEYLLVDRLQQNNFFYDQNLPHVVINIFATLNSILYVQKSSDPDFADPLTDEMTNSEPIVAQRDFTGLDFTAWAYDLFHPDEAYNQRGEHPSGNGIDRYIKTTDLTPVELAYLKKQGYLQWLNVLSPMMLGYNSIKLPWKGLYGNFSVRDFLTSFGNDISLNVLLKNTDYKFLLACHSSQNYHHSFPALEARMYDYERKIGSYNVYITPRILVGVQPLNQAFETKKAAFLGLAECKLELNSKGVIHPYVELSAKSKGWVAGNEFLDHNFSFRFGIVSRLNE